MKSVKAFFSVLVPSGSDSGSSYVSPHGISINKHTNDPDEAYKSMSWSHIKKRPLQDPNKPIQPDMIRIVCISDTHCKTTNLKVPEGDLLIHAGDFTSRGTLKEVIHFNEFINSLPHKHKVVIAGNHELSFGYADKCVGQRLLQHLLGPSAESGLTKEMSELGITHPRQLLQNCIYLQDSSATVCGLKIWGSPWSAFFHDWAYNVHRGEDSLRLYDQIPTDIDIVVTHGPPLGIGDLCAHGPRVGCAELYSTLRERIKPKLHVYGHIHEDHGLRFDGTTLYANASTCTLAYQPYNEPITFDFPLPEGATKDDLVYTPPQ